MRIQIEADHLHCMLVAEINKRTGKSCVVEVNYALYPIVARLNNKTNEITEYVPMIPIVRMDTVIVPDNPDAIGDSYNREVAWFANVFQQYEPINGTIEFPQSHSLGCLRGIKGPEKTIQWYMNTMSLTIAHDDRKYGYEVKTSGLNFASTTVCSKKTGEEFRMFRRDKWWAELAKALPPKK